MGTPSATWLIDDRRRNRQHQRRSAGRRGRRRARSQRADGPPSDRRQGAPGPPLGRPAGRQPVGVAAVSRGAGASARADPTGGVGRGAGVQRDRRRVADAEVAERSAARRIASSPACSPSQAAGRTAVPAYVVVGIGLNVGWAPEGAARLGDGIDPADGARPDARCIRRAAAGHHRDVPGVAGDDRAIRPRRTSRIGGRRQGARRVAGWPPGRARRVRDHPPLRHGRRRAPEDTVPEDTVRTGRPQLPSVCARPRRCACGRVAEIDFPACWR